MDNGNPVVTCEELEKEFVSSKVLQSFKGIELKLAVTENGLEGKIKLPWRAVLCVAGFWAVSSHGEALKQVLKLVQ